LRNVKGRRCVLDAVSEMVVRAGIQLKASSRPKADDSWEVEVTIQHQSEMPITDKKTLVLGSGSVHGPNLLGSRVTFGEDSVSSMSR